MTLPRLLFFVAIGLMPIAGSLLNAGYFGPQTLTAYFLFTVLALLSALVAITGLLTGPLNGDRKAGPGLPGYMVLFMIMTAYVFLHGVLTHTTNLTHYYWLASAAFLMAVYSVGQVESSYLTHYRAIVVLAMAESIVVILQAMHKIPSLNTFYRCTGTWENPNVSASFLAMAIYGCFRSSGRSRTGTFGYLAAGVAITAILLLQCRTAMVAGSIFVVGNLSEGSGYLSRIMPKDKAWYMNSRPYPRYILLSALVLLLAFGFKRASTEGRVQIWKNSLLLVAEHPVAGQGFGLFEKNYNLFIARHISPANDHINMPYNDFLELGVDGGIIAVCLWVAFIVLLIIHRYRHGDSILPVAGFLIIQSLNFGFQALPAFALFLLYIGVDRGREGIATTTGYPAGQGSGAHFILAGAGCLAALLLIHQMALARDFYRCSRITRQFTPDAISAYKELSPSLSGFQYYHLRYGDVCLASGQYTPALCQYLLATASCVNPPILMKCGYCYRQLHMYDSSEYYYRLLQDMQPYRFAPKMALLNLYEAEGDRARMLMKAREIVDMPIKVNSRQVADIKAYAHKILDEQ